MALFDNSKDGKSTMEIDCVVFDQPSSVLSLTVQVVNQKLKSDFKASYIFDDNLALTGSTIVKKPAMDENLEGYEGAKASSLLPIDCDEALAMPIPGH